MGTDEAFNLTDAFGEVANSTLYNFPGVPPCESYLGLSCFDFRHASNFLKTFLLVAPVPLVYAAYEVVCLVGRCFANAASYLGVAAKRHTVHVSNWEDDEHTVGPEHTVPTRGEVAYEDATNCEDSVRSVANFLFRHNLNGWDTPESAEWRLGELRTARKQAVDAFEALLRVRGFLRDKASKAGLLAHAEWESKRRKRPRLLDEGGEEGLY